MYGYFKNSLAQIPCQAPDEARYSLARDCNDCARAYKQWLCTVAFPRCEEFNSTKPYTQVRNVAQAFPNGTRLSGAARGEFPHPAEQASRNVFIDEGVAPGPYREILPCDMVCYLVVQSCPAALGFTCPLPDMKEYAQSYAPRRSDMPKDVVPCNFPGGSTDTSGAGAGRVGAGAGVGVVVVLSLMLAGGL
jgi:calcium channel MID1